MALIPPPIPPAPPLFISPGNAKTSPGGLVTFTAASGVPPYSWSFAANQSGGTLGGYPALIGSIVYRAGAVPGLIDTIQATDSAGNTAQREVRVLWGPTLAQLRADAQDRCDMVNNPVISTDSWNRYINLAYNWLYGLLTEKYGDDYEVQTPYGLLTDGINDSFALPPDLFKLLGVDVQLAGTPDSYVTLKRFQFAERNRYSIPNMQTWFGVTNLKARLRGRYLWFIPIPEANQQIRVWYVPKCTPLVADTDVLDGVNGWEELVIVDACIRAMTKQDLPHDGFDAAHAAMVQRLESEAENRDAGSPGVVSDTAWSNYCGPNSCGMPGGEPS